ncbi:MAG: hypothetical protein OER85_18040 [Gammaproteobacteria bacterium]|nr:hypothetical protein [Gammaproteobacteria bacterium]
MGKRQGLVLIGAVVAGLLYFAVLRGISQGTIAVNIKITTDMPCYPLPAVLLSGVVTRWLQRYWDIRLARPVTGSAMSHILASRTFQPLLRISQ